MKRLIVTADDVGLHRGMTEGAIRAHSAGIVTACSVVANGQAFDDAVARLREVPSLEVGVHLTLVEERALTTGRPMPKNYVRFILGRKGNVEPELRAQIEKVLKAGLPVTHLNGHQHLHQIPSIFAVVEKLSDEYRIGYVRVVRDAGGHGSMARRLAIGVLNRVAARGARTIGVMEAGHLTADRVIALLDSVEGVTELVTHPGIGVTGYSHWNYEWDVETAALCDPRLRAEIARRGIELVGPSDCG
ncbi:MAG TPA: ChbG/HpnK family deacetylase [Thermoanaerobaculia bacterium]|nr:ChbG/HpnK family deacetylase [Thermoanaerobaculia bacterium]